MQDMSPTVRAPLRKNYVTMTLFLNYHKHIFCIPIRHIYTFYWLTYSVQYLNANISVISKLAKHANI